MIPTRLLSVLPRLARPVALAAVTCGALAAAATATPAAAWWRGGVWIGLPSVVVGPPAYPSYYAPPAYYPPPPAYYPPPPADYAPSPPTAYAPPGPQQSCTAGPYVCPMDHPVPSGSGCYCLGNDRTQVWGRAS